VDVVSTLWVSTAVLYVIWCFTGSQCRDCLKRLHDNSGCLKCGRRIERDSRSSCTEGSVAEFNARPTGRKLKSFSRAQSSWVVQQSSARYMKEKQRHITHVQQHKTHTTAAAALFMSQTIDQAFRHRSRKIRQPKTGVLTTEPRCQAWPDSACWTRMEYFLKHGD